MIGPIAREKGEGRDKKVNPPRGPNIAGVGGGCIKAAEESSYAVIVRHAECIFNPRISEGMG